MRKSVKPAAAASMVAVRPEGVSHPYRIKVQNAYGAKTPWLDVTPEVFDALRVALDAMPEQTAEELERAVRASRDSGVLDVPPVIRRELERQQTYREDQRFMRTVEEAARRASAAATDMSAAHAEGLHDDLPREGCPECEDQRGRSG